MRTSIFVSLALLSTLAVSVCANARWEAYDLTANNNIPGTNMTITPLNETSFVMVGPGGHVFQVARGATPKNWTAIDLTEEAKVPPTKLPLTQFKIGTYPKIAFGGVTVDNHAFLAYFWLFSQKVWTVYDMATMAGVPNTNTSLTFVNNLEYAQVSMDNHVWTVSYNPVSTFFSKYDITDTANVPASDVAVSTLNGEYPNIQFLSVAKADSHVYGSYFNQPTSTGWAVYDFTKDNGTPTALFPITVVSGGQFLQVGRDNHVYNSFFENGKWNLQDLTKRYGVPATKLQICLMNAIPLKFAVVAMDGSISLVYFQIGTYKIYNIAASDNIPKAKTALSAPASEVMYYGGLDGHAYYLQFYTSTR